MAHGGSRRAKHHTEVKLKARADKRLASQLSASAKLPKVKALQEHIRQQSMQQPRRHEEVIGRASRDANRWSGPNETNRSSKVADRLGQRFFACSDRWLELVQAAVHRRGRCQPTERAAGMLNNVPDLIVLIINN